MWQGCSEGEDKHCDRVFGGFTEKTGDGVGNLGSAKWCCSEGGDEGNTCAGDDNSGGVVGGAGAKEMDSCRVKDGGVVC